MAFSWAPNVRPLMAAKEILDSEQGEVESVLECPICLQTCVQPVKLCCGHIFCFLCVKGAANLSKRCAMCRKELPLGYLDHPDLVKQDAIVSDQKTLEDGRQWFYEGYNGWWQYDERTSEEIESAFKREDKKFEVLIAGFLYVIDFDLMIQYRRVDPSKLRHIKRDVAGIPKKGIAGIRLDNGHKNPVQMAPSDGVENTIESSADNLVEEISETLNNISLNVTENDEQVSDEEYL